MTKAHKQWQRLLLEVDQDASDLIQGILLELDCLGMSVEDDETRFIPEKPFSPTGKALIAATFEDDAARLPIEIAVREALAAFDSALHCSMRWEYFQEEDWDAKFKAAWKSLDLGCGIHIVPSWEKANFKAPENTKAVLYLDPGMAFGTGHHETTSLCAKALVNCFSELKSTAKQVLDVGTGTGILAIIAAKLGATKVVGTDIDDDALTVAAENISQNAVTNTVSLINADANHQGPIFDIVVANILALPLIELAPMICSALAPKGTLILSGILATQEKDVCAAYQKQGLQHVSTMQKGDWVAILFTK